MESVKGDRGFLKKKDSENNVYLLAVKKLYELKLFDDYLFPRLLDIMDDEKIKMDTIKQLNQNQQPKKIPLDFGLDKEKEQLKKEAESHAQEQKQ